VQALAILLVATGVFVAATYSAARPSPPAPATLGPGAVTTTTAHDARGAIGLIGDSLSAQATAQEIAGLERAGWSPVVHNALGGRRTTPDPDTEPSFSGLAALEEIRAKGSNPHTWIIELGTNDVSVAGNDAVELRRRIDLMLDAIGPEHQVVWVNVHNGLDLPASATFNAVLAQVARERGNVVVADWATEATKPGNLLPDGIHLSLPGTQTFADLITRTATREDDRNAAN
jgi:hypothetical protein